LVIQELKVPKEEVALQEILEDKVHKGLKVHKVHKEHRQEPKVLEVIQELKVPKEEVALQEILEDKVLKVQ
jgi:hypothetical protein